MLDGRRPRIVAATLKSSLPRITPVLDVPGTPIDFCATKDRIITYGTDSGGTIRAFSDAGRPLWAQLVRPGSERPQAAFALARGGIYCAEQAGVVLVVSTFEPIVRAFSLSNGKQVWSTALSPFTSIEMDSTDAYRTVITIPPTGHDQTIGAYGAQKNLVAIQIAHIDPRTGQFDRRIDTRLLAANTGTQVDRRQGLFRVIGTETGKLVSIKP
jgi:outer membrane protein assembly factor BamB